MTEAAYRRTVVLGIITCVLAIVAFSGAAYAIVSQHIVATNLCNTINASRGPDTGTGFNTRQEYRDLWIAIGQPERAAKVPDAPPLDCSTGKPRTKGK